MTPSEPTIPKCSVCDKPSRWRIGTRRDVAGKAIGPFTHYCERHFKEIALRDDPSLLNTLRSMRSRS
jgi:hypothetical protein